MTTLSSFWRQVAAGEQPDDDYIRSTGIPERFFGEVKAQAREIIALKNEGSMGAGRELARQRAVEWKEKLGDDLQEPNDDPLKGELDPKKLAAAVRRRW